MLLAGCGIAFLLALGIGSAPVPISDVVAALTGQPTSEARWRAIVLDLRLPRAVAAVLAGAGLAVSGLVLQTLFRNPLAGPFVLGIDAGASLGVALATLATGPTVLEHWGYWGEAGRIIAAWIGSGIVLGAVLIAARLVREPVTLLVLGLMTSYIAHALVSLLLAFSGSEQVRGYVAWTFGSFRGVTMPQLYILGPVTFLGLAMVAATLKPLNALLLGEPIADSLGAPVRGARWLVVVSASILTGTVTAFCGPVAFLGVAVPHLARTAFQSSDHRLLFPASVLIGSTIALLADLACRLPGRDDALPLSSVTALVGAPVLVWVVLRRRDISL